MVAGTQLCFALDKVSQIPTTSQHNPENGLLGGVGHYVLLWTLPLSNKNAATNDDTDGAAHAPMTLTMTLTLAEAGSDPRQ